jgi:hypothetical protein
VDLQHNAKNVAEVVVSFSLPLKAILVSHIWHTAKEDVS